MIAVQTARRAAATLLAQGNSERAFDEAVNGDKPVLVDFWATWCGPCRMIAPAVEEVAEDFDGRAVVGKVDVDEQTELARRFGIMSIPTLIVMKDGRVVDDFDRAQLFDSDRHDYTVKLIDMFEDLPPQAA